MFDAERKRQEDANQGLISASGTENPFRIWRELGELMTKNVTVIRYNKAFRILTPSWWN